MGPQPAAHHVFHRGRASQVDAGTGTVHGPRAAISAAVSMRRFAQSRTGASGNTVFSTGVWGRGVGHTGKFQTPPKKTCEECTGNMPVA